jgi:hypothetical protein
LHNPETYPLDDRIIETRIMKTGHIRLIACFCCSDITLLRGFTRYPVDKRQLTDPTWVFRKTGGPSEEAIAAVELADPSCIERVVQLAREVQEAIAAIELADPSCIERVVQPAREVCMAADFPLPGGQKATP